MNQPVSDKKWQINQDQQRWKITLLLETRTSLHVGSGEVTHHPAIIDQDHHLVDINACFKGKDDRPVIPGSTIKGIMRSWFDEVGVSNEMLKAIFGFGHDQSSGNQGAGGLAEWCDAYIPVTPESVGTLPEIKGKRYPYWRRSSQTYIESSTAINRNTGTALHESLHYLELVPPGVRFELTVTGMMSREQAGTIVAALGLLDDQIGQSFGAKSSSGDGLLSNTGTIKVETMDHFDIVEWLDQLDSDRKLADVQMKELDTQTVKDLCDDKYALFTGTAKDRIQLGLQFDGPFLVSDPSTKADEDINPLKDAKENPLLPGKSVRGALRAQAERIVRSIGVACCEAGNPKRACKSVFSRQEAESDLCPVCQVFGATGWKSTINISDFTCENHNGNSTQQFVAIDRFHGGGKDTALYNINHFEYPLMFGRIEFTRRTPNWGKGLVALVLRDLEEGDICFGYGKNKGYGSIEQAKIQDLGDQKDSIRLFRDRFREQLSSDDFEPPPTPTLNSSSPQSSQGHNEGDFFNPYHFIPLKEPDTNLWLNLGLNRDKLHQQITHHSHAIYRHQHENGSAIYNGRIVCKLTAKTPLFIGAGADEAHPDTNDDSMPTPQLPYHLNGERAIPASSLRGVISSLAEAASNSSMRELDDKLMSYRKKASAADALSQIGFVVQSGNDYKLIPLCDQWTKVYLIGAATTPLETWTPTNNQVYYLPQDLDNKVKNGYPIGKKACLDMLQKSRQNEYQPGILRFLGKQNRTDMPATKKHEFFIPIPPNYVDTKTNRFDIQQFIQDHRKSAKAVPTTVIERFEELADQRTQTQQNNPPVTTEEWLPFHLTGTNRTPNHKLRLEQGSLIYYREENNIVKEISFSSIWRGRVEDRQENVATVHRFIHKDLLPFSRERNTISPAELLFGFIEKDKKKALAWAGKVRISAGILTAEPEILGEVMLKTLSSPKLPSPSLYFKCKDQSSSYIEKADLKPHLHEVKGRKQYLHPLFSEQHSDVQKLGQEGVASNSSNGRYPWESRPQDDDNSKDHLKVRVNPMDKGTSFYFHVDFSNLSEWELGMLCYALEPNKNYWHKIGMGKPIGLGSVDIDIEALLTVNRSQRYMEDQPEDQRYNQHCWISDNCDENLKEKYALRSVDCTESLSPRELRKIFASTMDADIKQAIILLGDPQHIKKPVHYPQVSQADIETENYKWFVTNDLGNKPKKTVLKSIDKNTTTIPALKRF